MRLGKLKPHIYRRSGAWWLHRGGSIICVISGDFRQAMDAFREECGKSRAI